MMIVKIIVFITGALIFSCNSIVENNNRQIMKKISEESVLNILDSSIVGTYNDFIDLGHGYFELANCRLSLFKHENEWALVFEKIGYNARSPSQVEIQIGYFGNCLENMEIYNNELSNQRYIEVENNITDVLEKKGDTIIFSGQKIVIPKDKDSYKKIGIEWDYDGKNYVGAVLKYFSETNPNITRAKEDDVRKCIPKRLKKIMVIDNWYQEVYTQFEPTYKPSTTETFQMLAKVLVTGDTTLYKPTKKPNTHWSFWLDSGKL